MNIFEDCEEATGYIANFGVNVTVTNESCGPTVTRYELQPEMGVKEVRSSIWQMISN